MSQKLPNVGRGPFSRVKRPGARLPDPQPQSAHASKVDEEPQRRRSRKKEPENVEEPPVPGERKLAVGALAYPGSSNIL